MLRRLASSCSSTPKPFKLAPTIRQLLASPSEHDNSTVTVSGWVKYFRKQKNVMFASITDGSNPEGLQAVFVGKGESLQALTNGAAVRLTGRLVPSPGRGQGKELLVDLDKSDADPAASFGFDEDTKEIEKVQVLGECDPEKYPIQKKKLTPEYLRDHAHLRARTGEIAAMIRLRHNLRKNIGTFFDNQGFIHVDTPVLTGNDAEGAGEAFKIAQVVGEHPATLTKPEVKGLKEPSKEFFSRPSYLTVSHQLHLEALATALSRVYTLSPCFRAERSLTGRHLAEFWMLEAEWAFGETQTKGASQAEEICNLVESCLRDTASDFVGEQKGSRDMEFLWKDKNEERRRSLEEAFSSREPWARINYTDAITELRAHHTASSTSSKFSYEPKWGRTLQSEHERWLAETLVKGPVFITDYPTSLKPFYMRQNADGLSVACFDLIVPFVGELVGGSVREERLDILEDKMAGLGTNLKEYQWYADLRKYGGAPHAGFGMGFERLVGWIGGIENVRECIPMPRWAGRMLL